jgi:hypothetical protein
MPTPDDTKRWIIRPKHPFVAARVAFFPDRDYTVTDAIYQSKVGDDDFADLCKSAQPTK